MEERTLDCRGLSCPQPVIQTKNALDGLREGAIRVIVDNDAARGNVCRFLESQGFRVEVEEKGKEFHVRGVKSEVPGRFAGESKPEERRPASSIDRVLVYIPSDVMGKGDDGLGRTLMAAFLDTLSHFAPSLDGVIFVNAGVKLAVEGSPVLDSLRNLEHMGVRILSCGTCLNHYGLKEKLKVGEISNMYAIIEALSGAGKIISP